jgi:ATP-dependent exoDNAse (exonuclease V) beta subunit
MSIDYLKNQNPHERDANITFKDEGHIYTILDDTINGYTGDTGNTGYTSVTTWIHSLFEKFDADKIIDNMMKSQRWPDNKYYGMTKSEIKSQWENNRETAANAGTKLHHDIECTYNKMPVTNDSIEYKYFLDFYNSHSHLEPYRTEMLVYDKEFKLAGSIDMIFKCNNNTYDIYDWKRSKEIVKADRWNKWIKSSEINYLPDTNYWHYALQLNTYKAILKKNYNMNINKLFLVVLHPDNKSYLCIPVVDLQEEVKVLFLERNKLLQNN